MLKASSFNAIERVTTVTFLVPLRQFPNNTQHMRVLTCFPVHLTTHAGTHMFSSPFNNTCGYSHVFQSI